MRWHCTAWMLTPEQYKSTLSRRTLILTRADRVPLHSGLAARHRPDSFPAALPISYTNK